MNVLVIGSGAREHAIAWALRKSRSPKLRNLFVAPGNAGTAQIATNLPIFLPDYYALQSEWEDYFKLLLAACVEFSIGLVVVQNEEPLAKGVVDYLEENEILVFGANRKGALLESSKVYSQNFLGMTGIPHASGLVLKKYSQDLEIPDSDLLVVKASGLAKGKGVKVAKTKAEVLKTIREMMVEGEFGPAGQEVVVQELLQGREVSAHAFSDGERTIMMPLACDYKRIGENDSGENTGGVGAYSRVPWVSSYDQRSIGLWTELTLEAFDFVNGNPKDHLKKIFDPKGVIYPAFFITREGPKVIEYNARFGDPETQVILPQLESNLLNIMMKCIRRELQGFNIRWSRDYCVCVVLCSEGYPDSTKTKVGVPIYGLDKVPDDIMVFHGATKFDESGQVVTNGGRVLSVVSQGKTIKEARKKVYQAIGKISFAGMYYRKDIALNT